MSKQKLEMTFDYRTIDALGLKLYSQIPPVLAEMISNSYDADAENVIINLDYQNKTITISDDGSGMSFSDINNKYLVIGRNRRTDDKVAISSVNKRKVTGKKGVGKLAAFGIASKIEVTTIKCNKKNTFLLDYSKMKGNKMAKYSPEILKELPNVWCMFEGRHEVPTDKFIAKSFDFAGDQEAQLYEFFKWGRKMVLSGPVYLIVTGYTPALVAILNAYTAESIKNAIIEGTSQNTITLLHFNPSDGTYVSQNIVEWGGNRG